MGANSLFWQKGPKKYRNVPHALQHEDATVEFLRVVDEEKLQVQAWVIQSTFWFINCLDSGLSGVKVDSAHLHYDLQ